MSVIYVVLACTAFSGYAFAYSRDEHTEDLLESALQRRERWLQRQGQYPSEHALAELLLATDYLSSARLATDYLIPARSSAIPQVARRGIPYLIKGNYASSFDDFENALEYDEENDLDLARELVDPLSDEAWGLDEDDEYDEEDRDTGTMMNERIVEEFKEVRAKLDTDDGELEDLGIISSGEAMDIAEENGIDLIMINDQADPPVVLIKEYSRHKFQEEKKKKAQAKKAKETETKVKELRLGANTGQKDYEVAKKKAYKFLKDQNKVAFSIRFKGRDVTFAQKGSELLKKLAQDLYEVGDMENEPELDGKRMGMTMKPTMRKTR